MKMQNTYIYRLLVAFDVFMNALFGGDPHETISLAAAKAAREGKRWGKLLCRALDRVDPGHCKKVMQASRRRAKAVIQT